VWAREDHSFKSAALKPPHQDGRPRGQERRPKSGEGQVHKGGDDGHSQRRAEDPKDDPQQQKDQASNGPSISEQDTPHDLAG